MRKHFLPIEKLFRIYFPKRINEYKYVCKKIQDKAGIEIGGPSNILTKKGFIPVYQYIQKLDNVNFSTKTIWEGSLEDNSHFSIEEAKGIQYVREATDLHGIKDSAYDFLISSHNIEHLANPLKAVKEWKRVVKPDGYFLFIIPNKEGTFDHKRPITKIEHLKDDEINNTSEADNTHFQEVLDLHDLTMDPGGLSFDDFKLRTENNFENRCLHHHVFDLELVKQIAMASNIEVVLLSKFSKIHLVLFGKNIK